MYPSTDPPSIWVGVYRIVLVGLGLIGLWLQLSIQHNTLAVQQEIAVVPTVISAKIDATHP